MRSLLERTRFFVTLFDWRLLGYLLFNIYGCCEYDVYDPVDLRVLEWAKQLPNLGKRCRVVSACSVAS